MTELLDLTPKFHAFYHLAQNATAEQHWVLWQEHYGFAAVPPTPHGQQLARQLLDAAWDKYSQLPTDLSAEARRLLAQEQEAAQRLFALLDAPVPDHKLVAFVGGFEGNPFVTGSTLCFPVEMPAEQAAVFMTHELTHLIHQPLSGGNGGWTRSLAAMIVQEGLATRATDLLHPDAPLSWRIGEEDWLQACETQREALVHDALPHLHDANDATLMRFLQPHPEFVLERTAYALGWWFVGQWLQQNRSLAELARVPENDLPVLVQGYFSHSVK